jgi:hypothetical protein
MIILILLIWLFVYFIIMWFRYVPVIKPANDDTSVSDEAKVYDYEPYSNPHEITTTPDYSISDAKRFLQQVIHDNYKTIGYSSDVSNSAITYNNKLVTLIMLSATYSLARARPLRYQLSFLLAMYMKTVSMSR